MIDQIDPRAMAQVLGDRETELNRFAYRVDLCDAFMMDRYRREAPWTVKDSTLQDEMNERIYWNMHAAQVKIGEMLVPRIFGVGGRAVVDLTCNLDRDAWNLSFNMYAKVNPVARIDYTEAYVSDVKIAVPHFEFFPADWICWACGCINSGLEHPRICCRCAAPRREKR